MVGHWRAMAMAAVVLAGAAAAAGAQQAPAPMVRPEAVTQVAPQRLRFILREGRKRQIRRMCELVGLEVVDLLRIRIGPLELGDLPEGRWRVLTPAEREAMIRASAPKPAGPASGRD